MADWADDDGFCWPSIPKLAFKSRQSERNTQRIVHQFVEDGLVKVDRIGVGSGRGKGETTRYRIVKEKLAQIKGVKLAPSAESFKGDNMSPTKQFKGDNGDGLRVTSATFKGDNDDIAIRKTLSVDTSNTLLTKTVSSKTTSSTSESDVDGSEDVGVENQEVRQAVERVWGYYIRKTGRDPEKYLLTSARRAKGRLRYREALKIAKSHLGAIAMMEQAVDALTGSNFHMSNDHVSWEKHLFPSAEKFQDWLSRRPSGVLDPRPALVKPRKTADELAEEAYADANRQPRLNVT